MAAVTAYEARAEREGDWWLLTVTELDIVSQCKRLDQAQETCLDLIATWLDVSAASISVNVTAVLDDGIRHGADEVKRLQSAAERATSAASLAVRSFATTLVERGYTVRDIGAILGVSPQRVSQLTPTAKKATPAKRSLRALPPRPATSIKAAKMARERSLEPSKRIAEKTATTARSIPKVAAKAAPTRSARVSTRLTGDKG